MHVQTIVLTIIQYGGGLDRRLLIPSHASFSNRLEFASYKVRHPRSHTAILYTILCRVGNLSRSSSHFSSWTAANKTWDTIGKFQIMLASKSWKRPYQCNGAAPRQWSQGKSSSHGWRGEVWALEKNPVWPSSLHLTTHFITKSSCKSMKRRAT